MYQDVLTSKYSKSSYLSENKKKRMTDNQRGRHPQIHTDDNPRNFGQCVSELEGHCPTHHMSTCPHDCQV